MPAAVVIEVTVSPGLTQPVDLTPYLEPPMRQAVEEVKRAADAILARSGPQRRGLSRPTRRTAGQGYGPLRGSLRTLTTAAKGAGAAGFVRTSVFYARFLEYGTKPYRVQVEEARALSIQAGGRVVLRHSADHPGIRARYWMRSAVQEKTATVVRLFEVAAARWAADAERGMTKGAA